MFEQTKFRMALTLSKKNTKNGSFEIELEAKIGKKLNRSDWHKINRNKKSTKFQ